MEHTSKISGWNRTRSIIARVFADILGHTILGEIGNVERFSNVKKLVAFDGLDPVVSQSGRF